jgi:osmoprotectant transport system permease protein
MTPEDGAAAQDRRVDRVAAAGAGLALAAATLLPFASFAANRIVSGTSHSILSAGPSGYALVFLCAFALAMAVRSPAGKRGAALLATVAAATVALSFALGQSAVLLRAGHPDISRVSIGGGAWLVGAGVVVLWFAALRAGASRTARLIAAGLAVAGFLAAALLGGMGQMSIAIEYQNYSATFWSEVVTHLTVSGVSLAIALVIGVPLGIASARVPWLRTVALGVVGVIQTVPSLALLGLLVLPLAAAGLPGIGPLPGIIALTLYALLPIVRNTYIGIAGVDPAIVDSGRGMGMSDAQLLMRVEVPLALPLLIEGVRAAAVLVIGIAAVVAFIGVGTLGVIVFEGFGAQANDHILLGAVPMVVLALVADALLRGLQRVAVSPGIRRESA